MKNTDTSTDKLFTRSIPESVTWNELFEICDRARRMSALLDEQNTIRKREGRSTVLKTAIRHNAIVRHIHAIVDQDSFAKFADANDCVPSDLPLVRYASHPKHL